MIYGQVPEFLDKINSFSDLTLSRSDFLLVCLFVCLHCELPLHMLTGSFCGLGISALLSAKPSGSLKCESGNLSVRYYSDLK